eukprot:jgi/Mesen1/4849/ME000244S04027
MWPQLLQHHRALIRPLHDWSPLQAYLSTCNLILYQQQQQPRFGSFAPKALQGASRSPKTMAYAHKFVEVKQPGPSATGETPGFQLRVVSYNILAQVYVKSKLFPHSPAASLSSIKYDLLLADGPTPVPAATAGPPARRPPARWKSRSQALAGELLALDADVLCLQEVDEFAAFYEPLLAARGYGHVYAKRPGTKKDGSAIFFRKSRLSLAAKHTVDYNDLVASVPAGDPQSTVYNYLTSAGSPTTSSGSVHETSAPKLPSAPVTLKSVYALVGREPSFTTYTPDFTGTLDYILVSPSGVKIRKLLSVPKEGDESIAGGLPNSLHPSDHLPIGAELELCVNNHLSRTPQ